MTKLFPDAFEKCNYRCVYCGKDMLTDFDTFMTAQEEHLIPRSKDGEDDQDNIIIACFVCNVLRKNWLPDGYEKLSKPELLHAIRQEIFRRRAENTVNFVGWGVGWNSPLVKK